jgi:translation initiation factor eIF-2B subunit epsilon
MISRDIVTRWTYPLVPDIPLLREGQCTQLKRYVYRDASVRIARTAEIVEEVVIGRASVIGEGVKITRSIIGDMVNIGCNSQLTDCHIWKGLFFS